MMYQYICPTALTAVDMVFALKCKGIEATNPTLFDGKPSRSVCTNVELPEDDCGQFQAVCIGPYLVSVSGRW